MFFIINSIHLSYIYGLHKDLFTKVAEMSFVSDKELLRNSSTAGRKTARNGIISRTGEAVKADDVVETAKIERELRKLQREQTLYVIKIQAWWRGRFSSFRHLLELKGNVDKKLADIENLARLLSQKGGVNFVPPAGIAMDLCRSLLTFGTKGKEDTRRLSKLCTLVIIPSLSETNHSKNVISLLVNDADPTCALAMKLFRAILSCCTPKNAKQASLTSDIINTAFSPCLNLLLGMNASIVDSSMQIAFGKLRRLLVRKGMLLSRLRSHLTLVSDPLIAKLAEENASSGCSFGSASRKVADCFGDTLVRAAMFVIVQDSDSTEARVSEFCREILGTPLLTALLSESCMVELARWPLLKIVLDCLTQPALALPPSSHDVFSSGQWLLGNISSLAPYLNVAVSPAIGDTVTTDGVLQKYLQVCTALLIRYDVPGILQGRNGVVWTRSGASLTAAGVPKALQEQVLSLLQPSFLKALCTRILLPLRDDVRCSPITRSEDLAEIREALSSSGLRIAQAVIKDEQDASTWFTAKWAAKVASSVTKSLGISSSSSGLSTAKPSAAPPTSAEEADSSLALGGTGEWYSLPDTPFSVSLPLIEALGGFWAVVLPRASSAAADSFPWRSLSSLAFATHAVDRLWVAALLQCGDALQGDAAKSVSYQSQEKAQSIRNTASATASASTSKKDTKESPSSKSDPLSKMFSFFLGGSNSSSSSKDSGNVAVSKQDSSSSRDSLIRRKQSSVEQYAEAAFDPDRDLQPGQQSDCRCATLIAFAAVLRMVLAALDDSELYDDAKPLPLSQILRMVRVFKVILYRTIKRDPSVLIEPPAPSAADPIEARSESSALVARMYRYGAVKSLSAVLSDIYLRWARRPFSAASLWEVEDANSGAVRSELKRHTPFGIALLRIMPWAVNFHERMKLFREVVDAERHSIQGGANDDPFSPLQQRSKGVVVRVRRTNILLDGMAALDRVGPAIKDRVVVRYLNNFGEEEAGIDIGGLFKDFLTDLSARVFDPSYGLFSLTSDNLLYPNPAAPVLYAGHGELESLYSFLGRVLGKALFENITVQPQFAHFFLAFMHGRYNFMNLINDLATLDQELYKNLMFLKNYEGNIDDLSLTFSVNDDAMGVTTEIELIPGGSRMAVTSKNRHRYINLVAKHYLYDRLKRQATSFFSGLYQVIQPDLLAIYCAPELQVLISGATSGVSLEDLKRHARYAGGYTSLDRNTSRFWSVVEEMSEADLRLLVRFVTSCERPPSLGFSALNPPFTIQRVECNDDQRLPTASTCFNTLKLPTYSSQTVLKDRLLTSIRSGAGFDLS